MSDHWMRRFSDLLQPRRPQRVGVAGRRWSALVIGEGIPEAWRVEWAQSCQLAVVESAEEAFELLQVEDYDLVVLNLQGLRSRPADLIASIRACRSMPVIVIGPHDVRPLVSEALRAGADDYLWIEWPAWEAAVILAHAVERASLLRARPGEEVPATDRDFLTGLLSPEAFRQLYRSQVAWSQQFGEPLGAIVVEVQNLRGIAHAYGAAMRDRVLREIAASLRRFVRRTDIVARTEEDRFAVLLPGASSERLEWVARGIVEAAATLRFSEHPDLRIRLRIGRAMREGERDVLEAAERALVHGV